MTDSIRRRAPIALGTLTLLTLLTGALQIPLQAQERTVIRHAEPEDGGGLVLEKAPPSTERRRALEAWHQRYVRRVHPLRHQARLLLRVPERTEDPEPACRALGRTLVALGETDLHQAPHFAVRRHVDTGLLELGRAVASCVSGRLTRAHLQWAEAEKALGAADRLLMQLGL